MNSHYLAADGRKHRSYCSPDGQSMVEMVAVLPVLVILLFAATDFGRLYYTNVEVTNAARAGAQYGSQSLITAADSSGMKTAASDDAPNLSGLNVTPSQCTCMTSATVAACPSSYCASNPKATFVEVDTSATFTTIVNYPGIACTKVGGKCTYTLSGKAVMRVEQ